MKYPADSSQREPHSAGSPAGPGGTGAPPDPGVIPGGGQGSAAQPQAWLGQGPECNPRDLGEKPGFRWGLRVRGGGPRGAEPQSPWERRTGSCVGRCSPGADPRVGSWPPPALLFLLVLSHAWREGTGDRGLTGYTAPDEPGSYGRQETGTLWGTQLPLSPAPGGVQLPQVQSPENQNSRLEGQWKRPQKTRRTGEEQVLDQAALESSRTEGK